MPFIIYGCRTCLICGRTANVVWARGAPRQTYGISQKKSPNLDGVKAILKAAQKLNFNIIDTAPTYGNSEHLIGLSGLQKF